MSEHPRIADIPGLLTLLLERGVEFILVGGAAAVVHGVPVGTQDIDIVHSRSDENVARLGRVLGELDAFFRADLSGRKLPPTTQHLSGRGQLLLSTSLGPVDLLCTLHDGRGHPELLPHTVQLDLGGKVLRVLDIATLVEVKTAAGRPKDKVVVEQLVQLMNRKVE